jgi:HK97 gp10 family phage protein
VNVTLDRGRVDALLRDARRDALEDAGLEITRHAQAEAPVRTGNLRRNIEFEGVNPQATQARVVSKAPYSVYVNNGTRYQRANPYMNRGVDRARAS